MLGIYGRDERSGALDEGNRIKTEGGYCLDEREDEYNDMLESK